MNSTVSTVLQLQRSWNSFSSVCKDLFSPGIHVDIWPSSADIHPLNNILCLDFQRCRGPSLPSVFIYFTDLQSFASESLYRTCQYQSFPGDLYCSIIIIQKVQSSSYNLSNMVFFSFSYYVQKCIFVLSIFIRVFRGREKTETVSETRKLSSLNCSLTLRIFEGRRSDIKNGVKSLTFLMVERQKINCNTEAIVNAKKNQGNYL